MKVGDYNNWFYIDASFCQPSVIDTTSNIKEAVAVFMKFVKENND